jgi:glyoxylase-like metal-dependent hydrolase (beta-lactamase superfamily II)
MERYFNCTAHSSSDGNLLIGDDKTALFDCGMGFCAAGTVKKIKNALDGRALDYIFITHTHYDHIGAFPFIKREWPDIRLIASEISAGLLLKDTPRRVIREFTAAAAEQYGIGYDSEYDDDVFKADITVKGGDTVPLGGVSVEVVETPGHTRDTLSFFIPELQLLIVNETPGVLQPDGNINPCFLTSCGDTMNSIEKLKNYKYRRLSLAHRGVVPDEEAAGYFEKAAKINEECFDFVSGMIKNNFSDEAMTAAFCEKYINKTLFDHQPEIAFATNAKAVIACVRREI